MKAAYCIGFQRANAGNVFYSMGVEYVLKRVFGEKNVTVVSDLQTDKAAWTRTMPSMKALGTLSIQRSTGKTSDCPWTCAILHAVPS